ncbi:MAG: TRAP transporter substrate-binding protein DctP [Deltaproteobacteria bacterium]|nr:TRAP transporter substrate-binding protein DctP [Deltaproteobacteria bacterium]MBW1922986.1 TRAP transporter substrate-binding protein DctP [Deltaproteobacteria bacterium]MBW2009390.1 TRAP transporter substrate-binding protein DctP [Deltaproteobacteria bacterium]MBW2346769.1 TRAP transporter substrate-binding protein DctP [Deltaproteobacteria bacterium]
MRKKKMITFVILPLLSFSLVFFVAATSRVNASDQITWKCPVHWPMASSSYKDSLLVVIERLKKRTQGKLVIEPYPAGALVPAKEIFNAVKRGMVPIGVTSSAYPRAQVPLMNVASGLPLNFGEVWEAAYFYKWLGFEEMLQTEVAKHGMLYFTDKVYPTELSIKKPVRSFEDFQGLKLRSSGILQKFLSSIGAAASYLPGSEIYAALASGVIDGAHWGAVQGSLSMKFYDISKYHLRPALNVAGTDIWLVNQKAFRKLPKDLQEILVRTLEEQFWLRTNQYIYLENKALSKIQREMGVELITLPPQEYAKMQARALEIWDEVAEKDAACSKAVQMLKDFNREMGRIK